jgi:hypothetical protein
MHLIQLLKLVIVRIIVTIVIQLVLKELKIVLILVLEQIKLLKKLGTFRNNVYLCSVRMYVLAIRVESRVG